MILPSDFKEFLRLLNLRQVRYTCLLEGML
jgi:hypothetical protein